MARGDAGSPGSAQEAVMPGARGPGLGEAVDDLTAIASDRCAALVAPQIERLTFAVIHASIKRAGPRLATYGVPPEAIDIVGQLRTGLAARPVSAAGLAAVYRYRDPGQVRRNLDTLAGAGIIERAGDGAIRATDAGRALLALMYASGAEAAAGLWSGNRAAAGLSELAGRLSWRRWPAAGTPTPRWRRRTSHPAPAPSCCCTTAWRCCATTAPTRTPPHGRRPGTRLPRSAAWLTGRSANASRPRPTGAPVCRMRLSAPLSGLDWCPA